MLLNVLRLFLFETFTSTDVIQPCSMCDQERTLELFQNHAKFFHKGSVICCLFFPRKLPVDVCILMLWDIVERRKVLSCNSIEIRP
jgi:hypothetical protein